MTCWYFYSTLNFLDKQVFRVHPKRKYISTRGFCIYVCVEITFIPANWVEIHLLSHTDWIQCNSFLDLTEIENAVNWMNLPTALYTGDKGKYFLTKTNNSVFSWNIYFRHVTISTLTKSAFFQNTANAKTTSHGTEMWKFQVVWTHNFPRDSNHGKRLKTLTFKEQKIIPPLVPVPREKVVMLVSLSHPHGGKTFPMVPPGKLNTHNVITMGWKAWSKNKCLLAMLDDCHQGCITLSGTMKQKEFIQYIRLLLTASTSTAGLEPRPCHWDRSVITV